jgi:hypothetical protein
MKMYKHSRHLLWPVSRHVVPYCIQDANTAQPSMVAEAASATDVKEIAHNSLRVYIAADKFGIYPLRSSPKTV